MKVNIKTCAIIRIYVLILSLCGLATEKMSAKAIDVWVPDAIYASVPFEIVFVYRGGEINWPLPKEITVVKKLNGPSGYEDCYYSYFVKVDRKGNYTLPGAELCDQTTGSVLYRTDPIEITVQDFIPVKISFSELVHMAPKGELQLLESSRQINADKCYSYSEYETSEYTEWGETKEKRALKRQGIICDGLPVLQFDLGKNPDYSGSVAKHYIYDKGSSKIREIRYYWSPLSKGAEEYELFNIERYSYDSNSRLSSITFNRCRPPRSCYDDDEISIADSEHAHQKEYRNYQLRWVYKILYKYHKDDNGYDVFGCNPIGATRFHNEVSADGKLVTTKGVGDSECWNLNDDGKVISYGYSSVANNGTFDYSRYFIYNSRGDLVADSPNAILVKDDDDYPWLKESFNYKAGTYYEYIYDEKGNWTRKTIQRRSNIEAPLETRIVRDLKYRDMGVVLLAIGNDYLNKATDCEKQIADITSEIERLENATKNGGSETKTNQIKLNKLSSKIKNLELAANSHRGNAVVYLERLYKLYSDKQDTQTKIAKALTSVLSHLREQSDFYRDKYEYYDKILQEKH